MRTLRLGILAAAVAVPAFLTSGASADCYRTRELTAQRIWVEVCAGGDHGCTVYQNSGSQIHIQREICVLPVPAAQ